LQFTEHGEWLWSTGDHPRPAESGDERLSGHRLPDHVDEGARSHARQEDDDVELTAHQCGRKIQRGGVRFQRHFTQRGRHVRPTAKGRNQRSNLGGPAAFERQDALTLKIRSRALSRHRTIRSSSIRPSRAKRGTVARRSTILSPAAHARVLAPAARATKAGPPNAAAALAREQ
jgi:hypothetical protein